MKNKSQENLLKEEEMESYFFRDHLMLSKK